MKQTKGNRIMFEFVRSVERDQKFAAQFQDYSTLPESCWKELLGHVHYELSLFSCNFPLPLREMWSCEAVGLQASGVKLRTEVSWRALYCVSRMRSFSVAHCFCVTTRFIASFSPERSVEQFPRSKASRCFACFACFAACFSSSGRMHGTPHMYSMYGRIHSSPKATDATCSFVRPSGSTFILPHHYHTVESVLTRKNLTWKTISLCCFFCRFSSFVSIYLILMAW
jgi:hypothetical protein